MSLKLIPNLFHITEFIVTVVRLMAALKKLSVAFACGRRALVQNRRLLPTFLTLKTLTPTYKREYGCSDGRIFECFLVSLGSPGTSNVRDRFRVRLSSKFRILSLNFVSACLYSIQKPYSASWHHC